MKQVWLVDDDDDMSTAISLMLRLLDCESRSFRSARAGAQALLAGGNPDLLILDVNMPELSGLDLLEFLRRRTEWKDLPILMLSSEMHDVQIDQALALGADGYVCKPATIEELESAIQAAFQKHARIKI